MRYLLRFAAALALLCTAPFAMADEWPSKPVRWVVPYSVGGGTDALARAVGDALGRDLKQTFIIDNRPGAATMIGAENVVHSAPDGYTIMSADNATLVNNVALYKTMPYDPVRDLAPVALLGRFPLVLAVSLKSGIHNYAEWLAALKAAPGKLNYSTSGAGTPFHIGMELIKQQADVSINHIPYKGMAGAVQDVLGGQVEMILADVATILPHIRAGKVVAIATASGKRLPQLPEVPTLLELGLPQSEFYAWQGVVAPAGTPVEIRNALSTALKRVLDDPALAQRIRDLGIEPLTSTPDELAAYWRSEAGRWQPLIKSRGITLE